MDDGAPLGRMRVSPLTVLAAAHRCAMGESAHSLSAVYGVSTNTILRWRAKWADEARTVAPMLAELGPAAAADQVAEGVA